MHVFGATGDCASWRSMASEPGRGLANAKRVADIDWSVVGGFFTVDPSAAWVVARAPRVPRPSRP